MIPLNMRNQFNGIPEGLGAMGASLRPSSCTHAKHIPAPSCMSRTTSGLCHTDTKTRKRHVLWGIV